MRSYSSILLVLFSLYSAQSFAQDRSKQQFPFVQTDQTVNQSDEKCLVTDEYTLNIPDVAEDAPKQSYVFVVKNQCNKPVRITHVINSCSCLTTQVPDSLFAPGEEKEVILTFNPYRKMGNIFQEAFIYTDQNDKEASLSLMIQGKVVPSADPYYHFKRNVGVLRFKRKYLNFEFTEPQQWLTERLVCLNSSDREVTISGNIKGEPLPSYIEISSEPKVIAPGQEADIIVKINNKEMPTTFFELIIALDGVDASAADKGLLMKINNKKNKK